MKFDASFDGGCSRRFSVGLALLLAATWIGCGSETPRDLDSGRSVDSPGPTRVRRSEGPPPPPVDAFPDCNLVFVSFDALQAAHVGSHGNPRDVTPTLDKFAATSYQFGEARSVASWTVPASMTWFTGVYPSEHRMTNKFAVYDAREKKRANLKELAPALVTLAEILRDRGYATGGFTGNAGVSGGFGYDQGFDTYYYEPGKFGGFAQSMPRAIEWLRRHRDRKFFLFLHGYDAHGQHVPEEGYDYRFVDRGYDRRFAGWQQEQELLREEGLARGFVEVRPADVEFWRAIYDEKIQRTDSLFRQFLEQFERLGVSDRTLFVLTSDHGTEFFEHRRIDHGFTLYDEQIRVPLVIKTPGQTRGRWIDERVSSIDVLPTILDLLGIELPDGVRGQLRGTSLVDVLNGGRATRDIVSETDYRAYTYKRSLLDADGWKLIRTLETSTRELYYLPDDPNEQHDVAEAHVAIADELDRRLHACFRALGRPLESQDWRTGLNPVYESQAKELGEPGRPGK